MGERSELVTTSVRVQTRTRATTNPFAPSSLGAVIQVETFGVSLNAEGTCFYGMQVEAVMDRIKDNISLDHLARLLVDVQQDSSAIVDSIISQYQRDLMQLIFLGDASNRNKVSERSERALMKARILAMDPAKWLQTATFLSLPLSLLTHSIRILLTRFIRFALASLKMRTISLHFARRRST